MSDFRYFSGVMNPFSAKYRAERVETWQRRLLMGRLRLPAGGTTKARRD